ncbi:1,2-phenylacetyl-CoA epoxidase subunit PaaD [Desertibacillus haloalkaliphilus]|uniref:1,2-phenylacetyl-CoA epoxidase subunit PaaD n=1 Tax=Desertibacillus haloalkaliphilus TaxID=1328930 RepID=UPI001C253F0C|nr:1,2-phenylacetyl-CoA epoxidase subunit PaaD [Desertibacillus haloalkaliphilus]MBU8906446.1 phenylacetate-CoA oxygenase subunit PaaJ [Desertibacillus haloalkaliphilus]
MTTGTNYLIEEIETTLHQVKDPEIPSVSVGELGMIYDVEVTGSHVHVKMIPTFVGCPALDIISRDVKAAIRKDVNWVDQVEVSYVFDKSWSTDRISDEGREKLKEYGITPPPIDFKEGDPWEVDCPYCGSTYTSMENIFGPAACRSILYCKSCKNPFEAMKPVASHNS